MGVLCTAGHSRHDNAARTHELKVRQANHMGGEVWMGTPKPLCGSVLRRCCGQAPLGTFAFKGHCEGCAWRNTLNGHWSDTLGLDTARGILRDGRRKDICNGVTLCGWARLGSHTLKLDTGKTFGVGNWRDTLGLEVHSGVQVHRVEQGQLRTERTQEHRRNHASNLLWVKLHQATLSWAKPHGCTCCHARLVCASRGRGRRGPARS